MPNMRTIFARIRREVRRDVRERHEWQIGATNGIVAKVTESPILGRSQSFRLLRNKRTAARARAPRAEGRQHGVQPPHARRRHRTGRLRGAAQCGHGACRALPVDGGQRRRRGHRRTRRSERADQRRAAPERGSVRGAWPPPAAHRGGLRSRWALPDRATSSACPSRPCSGGLRPPEGCLLRPGGCLSAGLHALDELSSSRRGARVGRVQAGSQRAGILGPHRVARRSAPLTCANTFFRLV